MEFEDFDFGDESVRGVEGEHVGFEVGYVQREAVICSERNAVDDLIDVPFIILYES